MKPTITIILTFLLVALGGASLAQDNPLSLFDRFTAMTWIGHYVDSEDSGLVHRLEWEYTLDSHVVTCTKTVPELGFVMETRYYWDWSQRQPVYLSLLNKEMFSRGTVEVAGDSVIAWGETVFDGGSQQSKTVYYIDADGRLVDLFYRKRQGEWVQGHLIVYSGDSKR